MICQASASAFRVLSHLILEAAPIIISIAQLQNQRAEPALLIHSLENKTHVHKRPSPQGDPLLLLTSTLPVPHQATSNPAILLSRCLLLEPSFSQLCLADSCGSFKVHPNVSCPVPP